MAIGSHNILSKLDRALVAYLISVGAGTENDTYPAKRSDNKDLPNTVCHSQKWRYLVPNSGVYVVTTQVMVRTDPSVDVDEVAADKKSASDERVSTVFDAFFADVINSSEILAAAITAAARNTGDEDLQDFTVDSCVAEGGDGGFDQKGNAWMDAIDLEIVCRPSQ